VGTSTSERVREVGWHKGNGSDPDGRPDTDSPHYPEPATTFRPAGKSPRGPPFVGSLNMAVIDYFLKIDGIEGESQDSKHKGSIELQSYSISAHQQGTHGMGGGGGAGKVNLADFNFVMSTNKASPKLFLACCNGEHIKKATLTCRKAGKEQQEYLKIHLSDFLVSGYQSGGPHGGEVMPVDQVSLNFSKIEFEYKDQKADGSLAGTVKTGWDAKTNKSV
jgi:type VI secretion system secreted protein Hcp